MSAVQNVSSRLLRWVILKLRPREACDCLFCGGLGYVYPDRQWEADDSELELRY